MAEPAERLTWCETLIEKLKVQLAVLRRARFGVSPEKFDRAIAQLELALEDIETAAAETAPPPPSVVRHFLECSRAVAVCLCPCSLCS